MLPGVINDGLVAVAQRSSVDVGESNERVTYEWLLRVRRMHCWLGVKMMIDLEAETLNIALFAQKQNPNVH